MKRAANDARAEVGAMGTEQAKFRIGDRVLVWFAEDSTGEKHLGKTGKVVGFAHDWTPKDPAVSVEFDWSGDGPKCDSLWSVELKKLDGDRDPNDCDVICEKRTVKIQGKPCVEYILRTPNHLQNSMDLGSADTVRSAIAVRDILEKSFVDFGGNTFAARAGARAALREAGIEDASVTEL